MNSHNRLAKVLFLVLLTMASALPSFGKPPEHRKPACHFLKGQKLPFPPSIFSVVEKNQVATDTLDFFQSDSWQSYQPFEETPRVITVTKGVSTTLGVITVTKGVSTTLVATDFTGAKITDIIWETDDPKIVSVDAKSGVICGVERGVAKVKIQRGKTQSTVFVTVVEIEPPYSLDRINQLNFCMFSNGIASVKHSISGHIAFCHGLNNASDFASNCSESSNSVTGSNPNKPPQTRTPHQIALTGEKKRRGPPKGNQNAKGNKGNKTAKGKKGNRGGQGAPMGNQYAFKPVLPSEEMITQYSDMPNVIAWVKEQAQLLDDGAFLAEKEIRKREHREYWMRMQVSLQALQQRERYIGWQAV